MREPRIEIGAQGEDTSRLERSPKTTASRYGNAPASESGRYRVKESKAGLLLEEVLERLAGVIGTRRSGRAGAGGLGVRSGGGVLFDGHAKLVELAMVLGILGGDAFFNRLGALELRARVEKAALLTAMQFELALRAFTIRIETRG